MPTDQEKSNHKTNFYLPNALRTLSRWRKTYFQERPLTSVDYDSSQFAKLLSMKFQTGEEASGGILQLYIWPLKSGDGDILS